MTDDRCLARRPLATSQSDHAEASDDEADSFIVSDDDAGPAPGGAGPNHAQAAMPFSLDTNLFRTSSWACMLVPLLDADNAPSVAIGQSTRRSIL